MRISWIRIASYLIAAHIFYGGILLIKGEFDLAYAIQLAMTMILSMGITLTAIGLVQYYDAHR